MTRYPSGASAPEGEGAKSSGAGMAARRCLPLKLSQQTLVREGLDRSARRSGEGAF